MAGLTLNDWNNMTWQQQAALPPDVAAALQQASDAQFAAQNAGQTYNAAAPVVDNYTAPTQAQAVAQWNSGAVQTSPTGQVTAAGVKPLATTSSSTTVKESPTPPGFTAPSAQFTTVPGADQTAKAGSLTNATLTGTYGDNGRATITYNVAGGSGGQTSKQGYVDKSGALYDAQGNAVGHLNDQQQSDWSKQASIANPATSAKPVIHAPVAPTPPPAAPGQQPSAPVAAPAAPAAPASTWLSMVKNYMSPSIENLPTNTSGVFGGPKLPSQVDPTQSPWFNIGFGGASGGMANPFWGNTSGQYGMNSGAGYGSGYTSPYSPQGFAQQYGGYGPGYSQYQPYSFGQNGQINSPYPYYQPTTGGFDSGNYNSMIGYGPSAVTSDGMAATMDMVPPSQQGQIDTSGQWTSNTGQSAGSPSDQAKSTDASTQSTGDYWDNYAKQMRAAYGSTPPPQYQSNASSPWSNRGGRHGYYNSQYSQVQQAPQAYTPGQPGGGAMQQMPDGSYQPIQQQSQQPQYGIGGNPFGGASSPAGYGQPMGNANSQYQGGYGSQSYGGYGSNQSGYQGGYGGYGQSPTISNQYNPSGYNQGYNSGYGQQSNAPSNTNIPGYGGQGSGYGQGNIYDQYLQQAPPINQINARNYFRAPQATQDFYGSLYQARGDVNSPTELTSMVAKQLPQFKAPSFGVSG